jgi:hypothetical protein
MSDPPLITIHAGAVEEWVIENYTHEIHAFHMHQIHFRVLEENDRPYEDPPLVDVVNVPFATPDTTMPAGMPLTPGSVRIKLYFPPELAGDIPFHCHLMQHEDNGMMAIIRVLPANATVPAAGQKAEIWNWPGTALTNICHSPQQSRAQTSLVGFARPALQTLWPVFRQIAVEIETDIE